MVNRLGRDVPSDNSSTLKHGYLKKLSGAATDFMDGSGNWSVPAGTGQPLDATLTALAAYNTNGLLTQTAADTFAGRTITGTANEITVTNGSGVAGNPSLSLPAAITATGKTITGGTFSGPTLSGNTVLPGSGLLDSNGNLGIGMTPVNKVDVTQTQNAESLAVLTNASAGAVAIATIRAYNGTYVAQLSQNGTGFTTSGIFRQNGGLLRANGPGGLTVGTAANQPLYIVVNDTQVAQFTAAGLTITPAAGVILATSSSPASNAAGTAGAITWDANFIYVCTASGAWKRAALTGGY